MRNAFISLLIALIAALAAGCSPAASATEPPPASAMPAATSTPTRVPATAAAEPVAESASPAVVQHGDTPEPVAAVELPPDDDFRYDSPSRVGATGRPQFVEFFSPT